MDWRRSHRCGTRCAGALESHTHNSSISTTSWPGNDRFCCCCCSSRSNSLDAGRAVPTRRKESKCCSWPDEHHRLRVPDTHPALAGGVCAPLSPWDWLRSLISRPRKEHFRDWEKPCNKASETEPRQSRGGRVAPASPPLLHSHMARKKEPMASVAFDCVLANNLLCSSLWTINDEA